MKVSANAFSHTGLVRQKNEDSFLADPQLGLFIVCDGVGGHAAGKTASETATQVIHKHIKENQATIQKYLKDKTKDNRAALSSLVERAIHTASKAIFSAAEADPSKRGMATTAEVFLLAGDHAILGHVGDSRIYLLRQGKNYHLTEDHSVSAEMVRNGIWTPEEALKSPYAHTLTRAVGHQAFVQVDTLEVELSMGDMFLLCSDGLCNYFPHGIEFGQIVKQSAFDKLSEALIKFAIDRGGKDNVTAAVVRVEDLQKEAGVGKEIDVIKKTEILKQIPLFKYFSVRELTRVLSLSQQENLQKGAELIKEGQTGTQIFIILWGSVAISKGGQQLATRTKGDIFGEMSILDNAPRSASATALEATTILIIQQKELFDLLRRESQIAVKFLWALSQSLNQTLRATSEQLAMVKADLESIRGDGPFLETD